MESFDDAALDAAAPDTAVEPRRPAEPTLEQTLPAAALFGIAVVLLVFEQILLAVGWDDLPAWLLLVVGPAVGVVLPLVLLCWGLGLRFAPALRLSRPSGRQLAGAALVAIGALAPAHLASRAFAPWVSPPEDVMDLYAELLPTDILSFVGGALAITIVAPLAEELLFRGLCLRGLVRVARAPIAIVATAIGFGAAHGSLWLMIPVSIFGVVLGGVVWRTGSLTPAWIAHAIFNGLAYAELCATHDVAADAIARWATRPVGVVVLCGLLVGGFRLLGGPRQPPSVTPPGSHGASAPAAPEAATETNHL